MRKRLLSIAIVSLGLLAAVPAAFAERKNPLDGQPAVRHRYEMRAGRFEIGPSAAFTLNRSLRHAFLGGLKAEYHITDMFSIGADVGYGFAAMDTGLAQELKSQYSGANSTKSATDSTTWDTLEKRFSDIKLAGDARVAFTPFAGKIGLFSKLFLGYDFYVFGGFAMAQTKNRSDENSELVKAKDANEGTRMGGAFGGGLHFFFNRFFAMGVELKDLMFSDNEGGGDTTRGRGPGEPKQRLNRDGKTTDLPIIDGNDRKFGHHLFVGLNFTFFLPPTPEVSR